MPRAPQQVRGRAGMSSQAPSGTKLGQNGWSLEGKEEGRGQVADEKGADFILLERRGFDALSLCCEQR